YVGNGPSSNGTYVPFIDATDPGPSSTGSSAGGDGDGRSFLEQSAGLRLGVAESDRYWRRQSLAWMHKQPLRDLRLLALKLRLLFNRDELPQIVAAGTYQRAVGAMGWPLRWEVGVFGVGGLLGA